MVVNWIVRIREINFIRWREKKETKRIEIIIINHKNHQLIIINYNDIILQIIIML